MQLKTKTSLHNTHQRTPIAISLTLITVLLVSSCLISTFNYTVLFASGATDNVVSNETDLKNAIKNAAGTTIITFNNDISLLESSLTIPANKDITLTSNKANGYYKLTGIDGESTISIEGDGILKLDGIVVTHESGKEGNGITVNAGGTLILYNGEILGNTVKGVGMPTLAGGYFCYGGGVYSLGVFEMYGGKISDNLASVGNGGGVYNSGTFKLSGGEISNNEVTTTTFTESDITALGGGVYNAGTFTMSSGKITGNTANLGGGVYNWGTFSMSDGEISGNTGGGVYHRWYTFTMSGGKITGNTAYIGGGVYVNWGSTFDRQGGVISGNTVTNKDDEGKDVYPYSSEGGSSGNGSGSSWLDDNNSTSNGNSTDSNGNKKLPGREDISLANAIIIFIGIITVTLVVVVIILFFTSKARLKTIEDTL